MNIKRKDAVVSTSETLLSPLIEEVQRDTCTCITLNTSPFFEPMQHEEEYIPVSLTLRSKVHAHLCSLIAEYGTVSVLLLHISELENIQPMIETGVVRERRCYHASIHVMEQVLTNVRRAVRMEDAILFDENRGAALFFPNVDQQGASTIIERVFNSVNLLQAETIVPPLTQETKIVFGAGSFPEQGQSVEQILAQADQVLYQLTLRPAITIHLWDTMPLIDDSSLTDMPADLCITGINTSSISSLISTSETVSIPFLQLPKAVTRRMKSIVPYALAARFRCIPVGRDHNHLTLAMEDPTDINSIATLHTCTGMNIYPVACDQDALNTLLNEPW